MFRSNLIFLLKEKSLTQKMLSEKTGIPTSTVNNWCTGKSEATVKQLIVLADFFEITVDYLIGRENDLGVVNTNANLTLFQNQLLSAVGKLSSNEQFKVLGFAEALGRKI